MNKSRPIYRKLQIDPTGTRHLLVTDMAAPGDDIFESGRAIAGIETWVVRRGTPGVEAPRQGPLRAFRSVADLSLSLRHFLAREAIGLRLYAAGREAFLWDVANIARAAGLSNSEIQLCQAGSLNRRVYCTHCKTMIEAVAHNLVTCPACEAVLLVRDHFSRRLAAFMGVKVDAEVPGEIPALETLYP